MRQDFLTIKKHSNIKKTSDMDQGDELDLTGYPCEDHEHLGAFRDCPMCITDTPDSSSKPDDRNVKEFYDASAKHHDSNTSNESIGLIHFLGVVTKWILYAFAIIPVLAALLTSHTLDRTSLVIIAFATGIFVVDNLIDI